MVLVMPERRVWKKKRIMTWGLSGLSTASYDKYCGIWSYYMNEVGNVFLNGWRATIKWNANVLT